MPKLATKEYCTGCTACATACPKDCIMMSADQDGFQYPVFNAESCVDCSLCEKACPVVNPLKIAENLPKAYAAYSVDEAVRMQSSSGGIFTEIAKIVQSNGGVVYGAAYNDRFDVVHICVETEADLAKLRGAKYAQSDLRGVFPKIKASLDQGQRVLFSGTPCQVGGLKAYLRKDYEHLLTVDFVCHGVPSPVAWRSYVEYRAKEDADGVLPCNINLRSKESGWSRYQYSNVFEYGTGKRHSTRSSQSLFMKLFVGDYISRSSCSDCRFKGYSRVSDITLGDFWGIWDIDPEMDDNKGTSVLLVHSSKGHTLLRDIDSNIRCKEVSLEQASQQNPSMLVSSKANAYRETVLKRIKEDKIGSCEDFFIVHKASIILRIREKVKRLLKVK